MQLSCSKSNEISIKALWQKICDLLVQDLAAALRGEPQLARQLAAAGVCGTDMISDRSFWRKCVEEFFFSKLVGPHRELVPLFAPLSRFSAAECFIGRHRVVSVLGIGSDCCAFRTAEGYCLKIAPAAKREKMESEYRILRQLSHKNVVKCFEYFCGKGYAALLLELLRPEWGAPEGYLEGLAYCHSRGILHGDLRLKNLGVDPEGNSKLFDFGNAGCEGTAAEMELERMLLKNIMASPFAAAFSSRAPSEWRASC